MPFVNNLFRYGFMNGTDNNDAADAADEEDHGGKRRKRQQQQQQQQQQQHQKQQQRSEAEVQRRREVKWLDMLDHWDEYMMKNYKKVVVITNTFLFFFLSLRN